jgi:hypothetical protein
LPGELSGYLHHHSLIKRNGNYSGNEMKNLRRAAALGGFSLANVPAEDICDDERAFFRDATLLG